MVHWGLPGFRGLSVVLIGMLIVATAVMSTSAAAVATVVGTGAVNIRACPSLECDIIEVAPLGAEFTIAGEPVNGFVHVSYKGVIGFAYGLYVATTPERVPYLLHGTPGCSRVALIFNIGIGDPPAIGILDTLAAEGVPATMFPMGWWANEYPAVLHRMAVDGFLIGSHGDKRQMLTGRSEAEIQQDVRDAASTIERVLGTPPGPWFTAYAADSDDRVRGIIATKGYLPIEWTVPANDYGPEATAQSVYERVMANIHDGAIVELHLDGPASANSTAVALPWIISDLRSQGYRFVTIPEMANPCWG